MFGIELNVWKSIRPHTYSPPSLRSMAGQYCAVKFDESPVNVNVIDDMVYTGMNGKVLVMFLYIYTTIAFSFTLSLLFVAFSFDLFN